MQEDDVVIGDYVNGSSICTPLTISVTMRRYSRRPETAPVLPPGPTSQACHRQHASLPSLRCLTEGEQRSLLKALHL
jgi:hypothetical protein